MKWKTILVDDEINALKSLEILIGENCPELEIISCSSDLNEAIAQIKEQQPDIVFLDIEMPDGSGFEIIEKTKEVPYKVIFTTAYEQYALKALKANASNYLLKPIDQQELKAAVAGLDKLLKIVQLAAIHSSSTEEIKISLPVNNGFLLVQTNEIIRVESDSNYCWFHLNGKEEVLACKTLKAVEAQLSPFGFLRVHNSHLVNMEYIEKYIKTNGGSLILSDQSEIPVSRRKKEEVINLLKLKFGF